MDHHRRTTVVDRVRIERVSRRLDAARFGRTTRNHHRNQQRHDISFVILLAITVVGGILLVSM